MDSARPRNRKTCGNETAGYLSWTAEWGAANAIELELEDEVGGSGASRRADSRGEGRETDLGRGKKTRGKGL